MIILIKYEVPSKIEQGRGKMKKIISNLSVVIFVIGCVIMEITTWFIDSYVMFYNTKMNKGKSVVYTFIS